MRPPSPGAARKAIMLMCDGNLYRILVDLMNSPLSEVKYNSSGVIGHLAMDGEICCYSCCYLIVVAVVAVVVVVVVVNRGVPRPVTSE